MAMLVKERVLCNKSQAKSFRQEVKDIWSNMKTLPPVIRQIVCIFNHPRVATIDHCPVYHTVFVRFFFPLANILPTVISAWIAWFPCLFYSTIYIGDLYKLGSPVASTEEEQVLLDAEATRLGSRALFFASVLSLFVNVILPAFVTESSTQSTPTVLRNEESWWDRISRMPKWLQIDLATLWSISHFVFAACMFATL